MMGKIVFESPTSPSFFGEQPQWLQYIPYNSSNKQRAKENRKPMTNAETKMRFGVLKERPL